MEFNSIEFINIFFPICLLSCSVFPKQTGYILIISSSIFYAWNSSIGFILLIISAILVHNKRNQNTNINGSKILLIFFLILPFLFFRSSSILVEIIPIIANINQTYPESLILPAGVSFYTFQLIGFLFDENPDSDEITLKESILFTLFFPQLIAGPIERATDLIPQIKSLFIKGLVFDKEEINKGLYLVSLGLFLKTFLGDFLATQISQVIYQRGTYSALTLIFSNGMVIYFDFLGYTFIALGLAKFFNINLTLNFKRPYASICVAEFWRRWHISLTNWFKDYIYKPFASRFNYSKVIIFFATLIVFILTSQWHGFGIRFLIWGMGHFVFVILSRGISPLCKNNFSKYLLWIISFFIINFLWLFFLYDLNNVFDIISQLFNYSSFDINNFPRKILLFAPIAFLSSLLLDPEEIIKYPKEIKNEIENNDLVILPEISKKITRLFLKITYNKIFIIFFLSSAIAFFTYSRTFIYFRF